MRESGKNVTGSHYTYIVQILSVFIAFESARFTPEHQASGLKKNTLPNVSAETGFPVLLQMPYSLLLV